MTPKADRRAVVDVRPEAVRLLIGRLRPGTRRRDDEKGDAEPEVRHLDSRTRLIATEESPGRPALIGEAAADAIVSAVTRYLRLADRAQATPVLVASESIGRSPDAIALVARLERETSMPVRVLSERRESQLTMLAVRAALDPAGTQLVVDLRAGATEVTVTSGREATSSCALPFGAATVAAALPGDPPTALEWGLEAVRVGTYLADLPSARPFQAFATGDAVHTLAGFDVVRGEKAAAGLTLADLDRLSDEVLRASIRKVARRTGDDPRRVALLGPAALILAAVLQRFGLERVTVSPEGLRDGIVIAAGARPDGWWEEPQADIEGRAAG